MKVLSYYILDKKKSNDTQEIIKTDYKALTLPIFPYLQ